MTTVIAFDVFGTVVDMSSVGRSELSDYIKTIHLPSWTPLDFPEKWKHLPPHPDSIEGIARLRKSHVVVTLSNGPLSFQVDLFRNIGINWDCIIPLEAYRTYKPKLSAYTVALDLLRVRPSQVMMVTANKTFGDIEAAEQLGMRSYLIRNEPGSNIISLAEHLGC
jgi:2-haloalkanoic acid dehalogenase type II